MFFSLRVLQRKGSLGLVWIAAHLDKRLKRRQVFEISIPDSVDMILNSDTPLTLRHSGQLLFGLVRLYARKCAYILEECSSGLAVIQKVSHAETVIREVNASADDTFVIPPDCFEAMAQDIEDFCRGRPDPGPGVDLHLDGDSYTLKKSSGLLSFSETVDTAHPMLAEDAPLFPDDIAFDYEKETERRQTMDSVPDNMQIDMPQVTETPKSVGPEVHKQSMAPGEQLDKMNLNNDFEGLPALSPAGDFDVLPPEMLFDAPEPELGLTPGSVPAEQTNIQEFTPDRMESLEEPAVALPSDAHVPSSNDQAPGHQIGSPSVSLAKPNEDPTPDVEKHIANRSATRSRKRQKRRNVIIDTVDGKPAVQLTGHSMRALVEDPSPLMIEGGLGRRPLKRQKVSIRVGAHFMSPRNLPNAVCLDHAPTLQSWYTKQSSRKAKANVPDKEVETTKETMDESALQHVTTEQQKLDLAHKSTHGNQDFDVDMDLGLSDPPIEFPELQTNVEPDSVAVDAQIDPEIEFGSAGQRSGGVDGGVADCNADFDEPRRVTSPLNSSISLGKSGSAPILPELNEETEEIGTSISTQNDFTSRTTTVLSHLETSMAKSTAVTPTVKLDSILKRKKRLDASRWFFECLVLHTRGHITMEQKAPYEDINIASTSPHAS